MNHLTVIGSINLDTTLQMPVAPKAGQTLHATGHFNAGGGKGANQAVAASRAGAHTSFIGAIGTDATGKFVLDLLNQEEIETAGIETVKDEVTGQAFIIVEENGENRIILSAGANQHISLTNVSQQEKTIKESTYVISQLESNLDATIKAFEIAKDNAVKTILNPAPALETLPQELLAVTDIIIPNETETEILTGILPVNDKTLKQAATKMHDFGIETVIITLGSKGAYYSCHGKTGIVPAFKVEAIDTTAAGDTFIGAFASVLKDDLSNLEDAILFGNRASSIAVRRLGAQPSIPTLKEIEESKN